MTGVDRRAARHRDVPNADRIGSDGFGRLGGDVGFVPDRVRKAVFRVSNSVGVFAVACTVCGHLSLTIDRHRLIDVAEPPDGENEPHA